MKVCSRCRELKPKCEFRRHSQHKDGLTSWCHPCFREARKDYELRSLYGITLIEFRRRLKKQGGRCALCRTQEPKGRGKEFHVDHDHTNGRVRGLLCNHCNVGLAQYESGLRWYESVSGRISEYLAA